MKKRNKVQKRYKVLKGTDLLTWLFAVAGVLSLVYFGMLVTFVGMQGFFFLFLLAAIACFGLAVVWNGHCRGKWKIPKAVLRVFLVMVCGAALCFGILLGMILYGQSVGPQAQADYVIVLGAGLRGERPSLVLQHRINAAAEYLKENPASKVVVSGGQGPDELISEAEAMQRGLVALGISKERIFQENKSTSTRENLTYSQQYVPKEASVVIVTNKFHVFRACHLAKECGYLNVSGLGGENVSWLNPTNYIRECMAVVKDVVLP